MKSMLEVVGALQGDKRNAFPSSVQYFLQEHTYEAFHVSVKNFCRGLIFESPEPCLFEVSAAIGVIVGTYHLC